MPQIINTNIASLNAQRNLNKSQSANQTALQRLSSGLRINSAKDDAAGLAISTRFNSQIRGLNVAVRNAGDGISLAQTAEGALGSMNDNLQRVRELAVQSANATNSDVDREALQAEVSQLLSEVSRTAEETDFNGRKLLDGSFSATFQIGANAGQTLDVSIAELTTDKLGASRESGVSALGSNQALGNGDLTINNVAITASQAGSDNASVNNKDASAIAKVAAINSVSDQTGVSAVVNENKVSGSSMTASADTGTIYLNGQEIEIQTTTDASTSRASVMEAINAVSDLTGVTAVDSGSDSAGVSLVAEDGRNITLGMDVTTFTATSTAAIASLTGLALGGSYSTTTDAFTSTDPKAAGTEENIGTYEGGYTLIAEGNVKEINISGGNGTGNGDIANAGLAEGVYTPGQSVAISETQTSSSTEGSLAVGVAAADVINAAGTNVTAEDISYNLSVGDSDYTGVITAGATVGSTASALNALDSDLVAYEKGEIVITASTLATGDTLAFANGTTTQTVSYSGAVAGDLEILTDNINAAAQTGGTDLDLFAEFDGTNIIVTFNNFAAAETTMVTSANGVTAGPVSATTEAVTTTALGVSGDIAFASLSGAEVNLTLSDATETDTLFGMNSNGGSITATAYSGVNGLDDGDMTVNGVTISSAEVGADTASATTASDGSSAILSSDKSLSAIAVAESINKVAGETGVSAIAEATKVVGGDASNINTAAFESGDAAALFINGVDLGTITLQLDGGGSIDTAKAKADAITAINTAAGQTGVTAEDNGVSVTLTAADGRNISVAIDDQSGRSDASIGALFGLDSAVSGIGESTFASTETSSLVSSEGRTYETTYGTVKLTSAKEIDIDVGSNGATELNAAGFTAGSWGGGENGQFLSEIDISTFEGATAALTAIDNAIGSIASQRADLGAIQNRMESTVSNLAITSENLSAANSRIQDADFAKETAELSRTQVLQQAGISILAQANQGPQQVLSLLG